MKKIIHLTLFLAVISAIAGGALAAVNNLTAPIIEENALAEVRSTLEEFFPNGNFTEVEIKGEVEYITNIYEAEGEGVIYKVSVQGFSDTITYLVAIDNDGNFSGYKVTQINDTQGYGSRVADPEFYESFIGQSIDDQVDTLSGATVSSTAVVNGLAEVVNYHNENY
ncbi:FMN-binding protein [Traorella massiliensis]|mgnify:CR=1 FL=1|uniref:FMN-binding protein n=1 Tax=Traorella massiliensis TaxID=1903263 RepID=UPI0008F9543C|nr:FMN-binding protein [Traorella massiliensis]